VTKKVLTRLEKYRHSFNTIDLFKVIAVFSMIIDHVGVYLLNNNEIFFDFGRIAAPLFFFLVGYNVKPFSKNEPSLSSWFSSSFRMLLFGAILTITYYFLYDRFQLNILLNMLLIRAYLHHFSPRNWTKPALILLIIGLCFTNGFVRPYLEYGLIGLIYGIAGQLLFDGRRKIASIIIFISLFFQFSYYWSMNDYPLYLAITGVLIWAMLTFFQFKELKISGVFQNILLVCSRYTLEIYFIHLFLLQILVIGSR